MIMNLFNRPKTMKKWRKKAWLIDPNKTKITLIPSASSRKKHVPAWVYRNLDPSIENMYAMSIIRMQYCSAVGCPVQNAT